MIPAMILGFWGNILNDKIMRCASASIELTVMRTAVHKPLPHEPDDADIERKAL